MLSVPDGSLRLRVQPRYDGVRVGVLGQRPAEEPVEPVDGGEALGAVAGAVAGGVDGPAQLGTQVGRLPGVPQRAPACRRGVS